MFRPNVRRKRNGTPILSREEIDELGEELVWEYKPHAMVVPQEIDIDEMVQNYLFLNQDFQYLSHCGVYLGMMVFNDTDRVIVYDPDQGQADYISETANTIIIDNTLLAENQEHRYRFTMGHEAAGHSILHREVYESEINSRSVHAELQAWIECRIEHGIPDNKDPRYWTDFQTMEWQANAMSSATLMPRKMVKLVAKETIQRNPTLEGIPLCRQMTSDVSVLFNVSMEAAFYRLKNLRIIPQRLEYWATIYNWINQPSAESFSIYY